MSFFRLQERETRQGTKFQHLTTSLYGDLRHHNELRDEVATLAAVVFWPSSVRREPSRMIPGHLHSSPSPTHNATTETRVL